MITVVLATLGLLSPPISLVLFVSFEADGATLLAAVGSDDKEARETDDEDSLRGFFDLGGGSKLKMKRSFLSL